MTAKYKDGTTYTDEFNTVIFAIGRDACTKNIGLDKVKNTFASLNFNLKIILCTSTQII